MPFRSKTQQRFMFATMPQKAKEWASETDFSKIPERVRKKRKKSKDKSNTDDKSLTDQLEEFTEEFSKSVRN